MVCPNCHANVDGCKYCPHCGYQLIQPQQQGEHVPPDFYNQYRQNQQATQNQPPENGPAYGQAPPNQYPPNQQAYYNGWQQPPAGSTNVYVENNTYPPYVASCKTRLLALLLCVFLGVCGVHRFYVGKIGTGLLWLFTGGLFGIGYVVDIILIAAGSYKDRYGYPLLYWS